ncbi:MAG: hypothetical protein K0R65_1006 [Crocinitomicaceae bacterium]|jgi:hypothetical protein|nr:hypothetical protein [Crocinitomicaceae bacterium]
MQNQKGKNKRVFGICLLAVALLGGIIIGKLIDFTYFKVEKTINLIDILSIIVTVLAAYFVTKILDKEKQDYRTEKDLIIKRTEDIYQLLEDSHGKVVTGLIKYQEAASHCKRINVSLSCIYRIMNNVNLNVDIALKKDVLDNTKKLRDLLTDTPKISEDQIQSSNLPSEVKDSFVHLTQNRILEIEAMYDKLRDNILLLQLDINKK